jgi:ferredoxin-thioredoxin reductase catalytic subunit
MEKEEILRVLEAFAEKNDFILNPDKAFLDNVIDSLTKNERMYGLRLCPCRIRDGSRERDLELLCPCNFKTHETWKSQGRCWCGLFVKRE